jgi:His/Glu/Gln/Arg/opine family amino acid ABC transporter permease subunit
VSGFFAVYARHWNAWWPQLAPAIKVTFAITICAYALSIVLGLVLAMGRTSRSRFLRAISIGYIETARGIPPLTILFILYFIIVDVGIVLDSFVAGFVGLALSYAGYMAENFRAGIAALHRGQREAALAVGMTPLVAFRYIILPQATRIVVPPMLNMLIRLLKESSICSLIAVPELMLHAKDLASEYFLPMHIYLLVGLIYFCLAWPMSVIARALETRMSRGLRRL